MLKKIGCFLLAGVVLSFAWPVRGQFGHEWGAMIPGALAAWITAVLSRDENWLKTFAQAVIFSAIGFGLGGALSYGSLVDEIVAAASLKDVIPQLIHVFLIGALWGLLGMSFLGFALSELALVTKDVLVLAGSAASVWVLTNVMKTGVPDMVWLGAGTAVLHLYNIFSKKSKLVVLFSVYGVLGFGLGFLISVLILWFGSHGYLPGDAWSLRDQIWGFLGGVSVCAAAGAAIRKQLQPSPVAGLGWQKAGFIAFASLITGINTWNVYQKWFQSTPVISNPAFWGAFLAVCVLILAVWLIYFLKADAAVFQTQLPGTLLVSSLFFCVYLAALAILKSIAYSGMGVWETAFTLFILDCAIFILTFPLLLGRPKAA